MVTSLQAPMDQRMDVPFGMYLIDELSFAPLHMLWNTLSPYLSLSLSLFLDSRRVYLAAIGVVIKG